MQQDLALEQKSKWDAWNVHLYDFDKILMNNISVRKRNEENNFKILT